MNRTLYALIDGNNFYVSCERQYSPDQEVYSIDESFLAFTGFDGWDLVQHGRQLRDQIRQWIGIPVCVGFGPSKTLAKLANRYAKKIAQYDGVCNLATMPTEHVDQLLQATDVGDVWGVGSRLTKRLAAHDITSAYNLKRGHVPTLRKQFGVVMERTVRELNGTACYPLEVAPEPKQQIICSKSFGQKVSEIHDLRQAVTAYTSRAAEKLRRQGSEAGLIQVFIRTNLFNPNEPQYHNGGTAQLVEPTSDTWALVDKALAILQAIYRPGFGYQKAGVVLMDISPEQQRQGELFDEAGEGISDRRHQLNALMDDLNSRSKGATVKLASEGFEHAWAMRRDRMTQAYTTRWDSLMRVNCH